MKLLLFIAVFFYCGRSQAQDEVTLALQDTTVVPGTHFCEEFRASDFREITNFQFTLRWDPMVIRLDSLSEINLPFIDFFNTNMALAPGGFIPIIWIDPTGAGVTMPDDMSLFKACYTAVGTPISSTPVEIASTPLNAEIVSVASAGEDIGLVAQNGTVNIVLPYNLPLTSITNVNCYNVLEGVIDINPVGGLPPYNFDWSGPNSFTSTQEDVQNGGAGRYRLILTDSSQPPLRDTFDFEITGDFDTPVSDAGTVSEILDCNNLTVTLNGIRSTMGTNITYEWIPADGRVVSGVNTLTPTVEGGGNYTLVVTDLANGCTAESVVLVQQDTLAPLVDVAVNQSLNCLLSSITLDGSGSSSGSEFTYNWQTLDGNIVSGANGPTPTVDAGGTYQLMVTNTNNGCNSTLEVPVVADTIAPIADVGTSLTIDCANPVLTVGGSNTSTGPDFRFEWTTQDGNIVSGATEANVQVDRPGTYTFAVINQSNGCSSTVNALIQLDDEVPVSDAGIDTSLTCYAPSILLGGSATAVGGDIIYEWTTADGQILSGANSINALVDLAGVYELRVRDTVNSCESVSEVMVANNFPPVANAGADQSVCAPETLLEAEPQAGLTGVWTSLSTAITENPTDVMSLATELEGGQNFFVWTTSTDRCPDYSRDTVLINLETDPTANDDFYDIPYGIGAVNMDLVANDGILTQTDWNIRFLNDVPSGSLKEGAVRGTYDWEFPSNFSGIGQFDYEICNAICPDFCDTAKVFFEVRENLDTTTLVSNAITPNGDGVNDFFIIDQLRDNPQDYENTELMVFNRWGNIVYHVIPYLNDWNGKNDAGEDLPEGTYYYVLKLNLADGEVIKGDITILR